MKDLKFNSIISEVAEEIPKYRRIIFKAIILGFLISENNKCIAGIYRFFEFVIFSKKISRRRFYEFLNSEKIHFSKLWNIVFKLLGEKIITDGRILVDTDDSTHGKSGKNIAGCDSHYEHANK